MHKRIPWPKKSERELLARLEAGSDLNFWLDNTKTTNKIIESNERILEKTKANLVDLKKDSLRNAHGILAATRRVTSLSKKSK